MSTAASENPNVAFVGTGVMSATLGSALKERETTSDRASAIDRSWGQGRLRGSGHQQ
jgi:hypothetical protein